MRYIVSDHLGSIASINTGASPTTNYVNESFTAFGAQRNGETWSGPPISGDETNINSVSRRGYTGETVLGVSMGLNHLNGRVEDSITGRFLSPDPFVPDPGNTQSFNRYSYANNNPLTFIDPSGFDQCDDADGLCEITTTAQYLADPDDEITVIAQRGSTAQWGPVLGQILITVPGQSIPTILALSGTTNKRLSSSGNFLPAGPITAPPGLPQGQQRTDCDSSGSNSGVSNPDNSIPSPPGVSVDQNIRDALSHQGAAIWFYNQVRNKGPWDYKQQGSQYQDFGNFNYGATGSATGFSDSILDRMAGYAQQQAGTSKPEWGSPFGAAPYGDDPNDQTLINKGIQYFKNCHK